VWLTGSSSLLVIGTPLPGEGGGEQEHRDILQQLSTSWGDGIEQPTATATSELCIATHIMHQYWTISRMYVMLVSQPMLKGRLS